MCDGSGIHVMDLNDNQFKSRYVVPPEGPSLTAPNYPPEDDNDPNKIVIGVIAGVGGFLIIVVAVVTASFVQRKRRRMSKTLPGQEMQRVNPDAPLAQQYPTDSNTTSFSSRTAMGKRGFQPTTLVPNNSSTITPREPSESTSSRAYGTDDTEDRTGTDNRRI